MTTKPEDPQEESVGADEDLHVADDLPPQLIAANTEISQRVKQDKKEEMNTHVLLKHGGEQSQH